MKRLLPFLIILLVAAAAATSGTIFYRAQKAKLAVAAAAVAMETAGGKPGAKPPHIRGEPEAKATIEEFGDYQCPPCGLMAPELLKLEHDYGKNLRVIFRQFPLAVHAHGMQAARTAEAAGMQGKFWEMHDLLYRKQTSWANQANVDSVFADYASSLALDPARFAKDLESEEAKERIAADQARADSLGVTSTPTLYLNGQRLPPTSYAEVGLRTAIDAAIAGKPFISPTPTPTPTQAPAITLKPNEPEKK